MKQAKYKKLPFQISMETVTNITLSILYVSLFAFALHVGASL